MGKRMMIGALALLLTACAPPPVESEAPADSAAPAEASTPAVEPALAVAAIPLGRDSAIANTSVSITGDLEVGDSALVFTRDQTYQTQRAGTVEASQAYAASGETFASALGVAATTGLELRQVTSSQIGARARNGGLCRRDTVTFVALAAATDSSGMPALWIAAFKGATQPGPNGAASDLCGVFTYAPASL